MIRASKAADPAKPFFLYFAHGAVHAPLHAKADDIARHRGRYDAGWDALRERALRAPARARASCRPGTELPPRNTEPGDDVVAWDDARPTTSRQLFARYMEVYAAMVDKRRPERRPAAARRSRSWASSDNTIFLFTCDNGASREGRARADAVVLLATPRHGPVGQGRSATTTATSFDVHRRPDDVAALPAGLGDGLQHAVPALQDQHVPRAATRCPFVLSWPGRHRRTPAGSGASTRTSRTCCPRSSTCSASSCPTERNGLAASSRSTGAQLRAHASTTPDAPSTHTRAVLRDAPATAAYYRDGWEIVTLHQPLTPFAEDEWQLFDTANDPTRSTTSPTEHPERVAELVAGLGGRGLGEPGLPARRGHRHPVPLAAAVRPAHEQPVTMRPGTPTLERYRSSRLIARPVVPDRRRLGLPEGDEGVVFAHGGQESGYVLYVEDGELYSPRTGTATMTCCRRLPARRGEHARS